MLNCSGSLGHISGLRPENIQSDRLYLSSSKTGKTLETTKEKGHILNIKY